VLVVVAAVLAVELAVVTPGPAPVPGAPVPGAPVPGAPVLSANCIFFSLSAIVFEDLQIHFGGISLQNNAMISHLY